MDKSKFLLIVLIFSITINIVQLIKIKNLQIKLAACELKRAELASVIEINKRVTLVQQQQLIKLEKEIATQNKNTQTNIKTILNAPVQADCINAVNQGLQELHKH